MSGGGYGGQAQSYGSPPQGGYGQQQQRYPSAYGGGYGGGPRMGIGAPGAQYGGLTGQQPQGGQQSGFWQEKPGPLTQSDSHYGLRQPWPGQAAPWGFDRWQGMGRQDKGGGGGFDQWQPDGGQAQIGGGGVIVGSQPPMVGARPEGEPRMGINPPGQEYGGLGGSPSQRIGGPPMTQPGTGVPPQNYGRRYPNDGGPPLPPEQSYIDPYYQNLASIRRIGY